MRDGRSVGWTGGRSVGHWSVRRSEERGDGRADERSIEQIHVAVGRTVQRPTVDHTDGGKGKRSEGRSLGRAGGPRSTVGRADRRKNGRKNGRADGTGWNLIKANEAGQIEHPTAQYESRRNARNKHREMCCARGCKEALLQLANFGTETCHAQLVEGTSDFFAVESKAQGRRLNDSSFSDCERW